MGNRVYLSGPSNGENDLSIPITTNWKAYATSMFLQSGLIVSNPIDLDLTGFIDKEDSEAHDSSVKHSLNLIDKSDSVLANIYDKSDATTMELFYAHRQGKRVVVVGNEPYSPWILSHSEVRFQKLKEALEYLVGQPSTMDTVTWSTQFENEMNKRSEQYPQAGCLDYEYYGGTHPVLVVSPHATSFFKEGVLSPAESYTGTMAALLHKLTGCHSLTTSYCTAADPVYYLTSPFPTFLIETLKKIDVKLVLFLHGLDDWNNKSDINLESWNKDLLVTKAEYINLFTSMLAIKEFKGVTFASLDKKISDSKTIYELIGNDVGIPTMRVDVHKRFRLPQMQPDLYSKVVTSLAQFIMLV